MDIRPFYAALLGMLFFVLSVRTLRLRRKLQIAIGDAGNQQLLRAMRIHSNFAGELRACGRSRTADERCGAPLPRLRLSALGQSDRLVWVKQCTCSRPNCLRRHDEIALETLMVAQHVLVILGPERVAKQYV